MVSSLNLGSVNQNQHYGVAKQENNLYHVNFRAENDRDVYVPSRPREAQAMPMPRPQAPSNYNQQAMLMRKLQEAEQAQKKEKRKSNLAWLLGIGASAAMIYMAFFRGKEPAKTTQLIVENVENKQTFEELHMPQELKEAVDKAIVIDDFDTADGKDWTWTVHSSRFIADGFPKSGYVPGIPNSLRPLRTADDPEAMVFDVNVSTRRNSPGTRFPGIYEKSFDIFEFS